MIHISEDLSTVETDAVIRILNPFNEEFDAIKIWFRMRCDIKFEVTFDFTITGSISNLNINATTMEQYFKSKVTNRDIDIKTNLLIKELLPFVNGQLQGGMKLPLPRVLTNKLSRSRLFIYDKFIMVESDPNVDDLVRIGIEKATEELQKSITGLLN